MTGLTARNFGLAGRGVLQVGAHADLVLFDATTVHDRASYAQPTLRAQGISAVLVNAMQEQQQQIAAQQKEISDLQARLTNLDPNAPPASFNLFNMLSVIAFAGFACMWLQQRRSKRGES